MRVAVTGAGHSGVGCQVPHPALHGRDLAYAVAQQAPVQGRQLRHGDDVARGETRGDLIHLVGQPQPLEQREHLGEDRRIPFGE
jgi:hypothetical protein